MPGRVPGGRPLVISGYEIDEQFAVVRGRLLTAALPPDEATSTAATAAADAAGVNTTPRPFSHSCGGAHLFPPPLPTAGNGGAAAAAEGDAPNSPPPLAPVVPGCLTKLIQVFVDQADAKHVTPIGGGRFEVPALFCRFCTAVAPPYCVYFTGLAPD